MSDKLGFFWSCLSTPGLVGAYIWALFRPVDLTGYWALVALLVGIQAHFFLNHGRRARPHPKPVLRVTRGRIIAAQVALASAYLAAAYQMVRFLIHAGDGNGWDLESSAAGLAIGLFLVYSVTTLISYGLCLHNVLDWMMSPDEPGASPPQSGTSLRI